MELMEKLRILSDAAKYDVSCSSSGVERTGRKGMIGSSALAGICHSWAADGRCISLLKVLYSNACTSDCAYCLNRVSNDVPRATFTPEELAELTIRFYRRNYIEGLFLSSAVLSSPDATMEKMIRVLQKLRTGYNFNGYIHLKAIPGTSRSLLHQAGLLADRMSVNIELPSVSGLRRLAPQKKPEAILGPMGYLGEQIQERQQLLPVRRGGEAFVPGGQSTQLIVGATRDSDLRILQLSERLYNAYSLKRVYYSAYMPINNLPGILPAFSAAPPLLREHRMYQADWLLRFYGFGANELLDEEHPSFDERMDPKADWAIRHLDQFPVEINRASREMLLRVPGIGVLSAKRILAARRFGPLAFADLERMRVGLKRARHFITCGGKFQGMHVADPSQLRHVLTEPGHSADPRFEQMTMAAFEPQGSVDENGTRILRHEPVLRVAENRPGIADSLIHLPEESVPFFAQARRLMPGATHMTGGSVS